MERAVCIRCGLLKSKTFQTCPRCGLVPGVNDETMAKSIRLSTRFETEEGEFLSVAALRAVSEQIEGGRPFEFPAQDIAALLEQKRLLDRGLSPGDVAKIVLFILALMVPGLIGLFLLLR